MNTEISQERVVWVQLEGAGTDGYGLGQSGAVRWLPRGPPEMTFVLAPLSWQ